MCIQTEEHVAEISLQGFQEWNTYSSCAQLEGMCMRNCIPMHGRSSYITVWEVLC